MDALQKRGIFRFYAFAYRGFPVLMLSCLSSALCPPPPFCLLSFAPPCLLSRHPTSDFPDLLFPCLPALRLSDLPDSILSAFPPSTLRSPGHPVSFSSRCQLLCNLSSAGFIRRLLVDLFTPRRAGQEEYSAQRFGCGGASCYLCQMAGRTPGRQSAPLSSRIRKEAGQDACCG